MQFFKDDEVYKVARVTGVTHNFLALKLTDCTCCTEIKSLATKPNDIHKLDSEDVYREVLLGVKDANSKLNKNYFIAEIQFIPSDSKPVSVYRFLAHELITKISNDIW